MTISIARAAAAVEIRVSDRRDDACALCPSPARRCQCRRRRYRRHFLPLRLSFPPPPHESVSRALIIDICAMRFDEGLYNCTAVEEKACIYGEALYSSQRKGRSNAELKP